MARRVRSEVNTFLSFLGSLPSPNLQGTSRRFARPVGGNGDAETDARKFLLRAVGTWDVNEINVHFKPATGTPLNLVVSVPDDYPEMRPFCFSDSHDAGTWAVCPVCV